MTTLRDAEPVLNSFITYHLAIGFDHLFLFFDDPDDASIPVAAGRSNVTVTVNDAALRRRWEQAGCNERTTALCTFADSEVMARQLLNVGVAIELALEKQVDWLLHIDSDELFYTPAQTVQEHFQSLADRGIMRAVYRNCEAIPEAVEVRDYFRDVTLFKRNPETLRREGLAAKCAELTDLVPQLPPNFFYFYSNGKSAARVRPGLVAPGVHGFRQPEEFGRPMTLYNRITNTRAAEALLTAIPPLRETRRRWSQRVARSQTCDTPAILHYPCCGFENFWRKYRTLGSFAPSWFGRVDIASQIGPFHLESRDVVLAGDKEAALAFYEQRMVLEDQRVIDRLLECRLFCRVTTPSTLLARLATGEAR